MPDANELTIYIFSALVRLELKRISDRTSSALQALKARGLISAHLKTLQQKQGNKVRQN